MNRQIATVIIAPMSTRGGSYPKRLPCEFGGKRGQVVLDQLRAVDKRRLFRRLGELAPEEQQGVLRMLAKMFAE